MNTIHVRASTVDLRRESPHRFVGAASAKARRAMTLVLGLVTLLVLGGCPTVDKADVASWREAVVAAREQSQLSFKAVNQLVRESQVARASQLDRLSEQDFTPALEGNAIDRWNGALSAMAAYAGALEQLLSPEQGKGVGESLRRTGAQLGKTAEIPALAQDGVLSRAIGGLGTALVNAAANAKAREIMLQADPSVQELCLAMGNILLWERMETKQGMSEPELIRSGVVVTVEETWDNRLAKLQADFRGASTDQKPRQVRAYVEALNSKEAAVGAILSLRSTILDLAPAHAAAAQGRQADLDSIIASAREQIEIVKELLAELKAARSQN
ncbi:MAG: hypothetical protein SFZ23_15520 [Planctomycetota bacterium]|nr:hypothetical protein [Planctomycetota bacterium]